MKEPAENGSSGIHKVNLTGGNAIQSVELADKYFGEGITILNNKIYQLTYKDKKDLFIDLNNFALIDSFQFNSSTKKGGD